ncbi:MAG: hypothetical protein M1833_000964 [Piccolia ochrophora]|nr:MAG: hypothetical protein M1833_000964 [Piccolia ochrophora]
MSVGQLARNRALSQNSNRSRSGSAASQRSEAPLPDFGKMFDPCASTASMFLYAQGSSILCLHHDTLALDRRFQRHTEEIVFIAVDNLSERGAGRLVVSYDVGQTAIVWDLFSGDEVARFASYEHICVAAWMRNGNVAFGNSQGNVILFEPATSEHISARTIFDPITAIAPASDCQTYALGYMNGSILIATLQPSFTILHTLNTSRAPSPLVSLAWHGSTSRQKSDMLATQTQDGDLRVWSIAKIPASDPPRVVRVLKRSENYEPGPNWLSWSKNGRIVQFSEGETCAWDVRTKHVTYEPVPTLNKINGLAIYGPTATLFTLGKDHTVQQFDLNPPIMVANKQHLPPIPPPSPPVSIEEQKSQDRTDLHTQAEGAHTGSRSRATSSTTKSSREDTASAVQKIANEMDQLEERRLDRVGTRSPASSSTSRSQAASTSSRSTASRGHQRSRTSQASKVTSEAATTLSYGSSIHSSRDSLATGTSPSIASSRSSRFSRPRTSRLRQEVIRSPEDPDPLVDLFPYTRARLSDVPYRNPQNRNKSNLTPADLRREMLSVVFGWESDIRPLIKDELARHVPGSASALFLSKWLGDVEPSVMAAVANSDTMMSDWMLLTLSQIGGGASTMKMGQAVAQRSLEKGDINSAATILLGLGNENDAVEVYVSHRRYMEAVLLTCLVFPNDWQRQSELVRTWGEYAVKHSEQHLAIRCFSCTGVETSTVLTSPRATEAVNVAQHQSIPNILSPPLSPPSEKPGRMTTKNSALKLITSFGDKNTAMAASKSKFFGVGDDDRTPMNAAGITPIAESAISPGGDNPLLRPSLRHMKAPDSATRTATPGGFARNRLPSIGETPTDVTPQTAFKKLRGLPTPVDSSSDKEKSELSRPFPHSRHSSRGSVDAPPTLSSAKYEPLNRTQSPMSQVSNKSLPSPAQNAFTVLKQESRTRNGSRDRKPDGLQIQWPPMEAIITGDYMSPGSEISDRTDDRSRTSKSKSRSRVRGHGRIDVATPPLTAASLRSNTTAESINSNRSPLQSGRSIDKFISSLDEANFHARQTRDHSRRRKEGEGRSRQGSVDNGRRSRSHGRVARTLDVRDHSEGRGRSNQRYIKPAKRSPSSPVPMSPEDLNYHKPESYDDERFYNVSSPVTDQKKRERSRLRTASSKHRAESIESRSTRRRSPDRHLGSRANSKAGLKTSSRGPSRRQSPDGKLLPNERGRSQLRAEGSVTRSPSSPLPMSPQAKLYRADRVDETLGDTDPDRKRLRSRQRSTSRRPQERGLTARRDASPDPKSRRERERSTSRRPYERSASARPEQRERSRAREPVIKIGEHARTKSITKELAAQELEDRRQSLAMRASEQSIPLPGASSIGRSPINEEASPWAESLPTWRSPSERPELIQRSKTTGPESSSMSAHPSTPRAMRHPKYSDGSKEIPAVPEIPDNLPSLNQEINGGHAAEQFGQLPTSVYTPHHRLPPRSMSVPIPEEPSSPPPLPAGLPTHPAFQHALPPSSRRRELSPTGETTRTPAARKVNGAASQPGTLGYEARNNVAVYVGIDETLNATTGPSNNAAGTTSPPMLPELKHLAVPPPPPPPPMRPGGHSRNNSTSTGASIGNGSDVINIGIDDGSHNEPAVINVPTPSQSAQGQRGRTKDDSLTGQFRRATLRMRTRSGSRNRNKSPPIDLVGRRTASPYESVPLPPQMEIPVRANTVSPNLERHPREITAGMTPNMVRSGYMEGGMI